MMDGITTLVVMPLAPTTTTTITITPTATGTSLPGDLATGRFHFTIVCGVLGLGLLGLAALWVKSHYDRKPKPIVKPVQVEPVRAPQQSTPGEWMEMVSLLRSEAPQASNTQGNPPLSANHHHTSNLQTSRPAVVPDFLRAHDRTNIRYGSVVDTLYDHDDKNHVSDQIPLWHLFNQTASSAIPPTGSSAVPQGDSNPDHGNNHQVDGNPQHKGKTLGWFKLKVRAVWQKFK